MLSAVAGAFEHIFAPDGRFLRIILTPSMTRDVEMEVIVPESALKAGLLGLLAHAADRVGDHLGGGGRAGLFCDLSAGRAADAGADAIDRAVRRSARRRRNRTHAGRERRDAARQRGAAGDAEDRLGGLPPAQAAGRTRRGGGQDQPRPAQFAGRRADRVGGPRAIGRSAREARRAAAGARHRARDQPCRSDAALWPRRTARAERRSR